MTIAPIQPIIDHYARRALPPMVILDVTNLCNLKCIHCPQPLLQARPDFKATFMPWEGYVRLMDEIREHGAPTLVRFVGDGEPLLHPRIMEMIRYAKGIAPIIANLTTNGRTLNDKRIDELLDAGIDLIDISIDALSKPTYDQVRRGGDYGRLLRNIFSLLDKIRKGHHKTKTMVSFIRQDENDDEAEWFRRFWEPLVDCVMVRSLHSAAGQVKVEESRERNAAEGSPRYPCPHLWKRLTVDFAGRIKFCAHDWETGSVLGHMDRDSLSAIWQGETLRAMRQGHLDNHYPAGGLCGPCTDWASSRWDYGYERLIDRVVVGGPALFPVVDSPGGDDPLPGQ